MQDLSNEHRFISCAGAILVPLSFALASSGLAWLVQICLTRWFAVPAMPFLIGFAAVIVSATWAGLGPGLSSIAAVTAFSLAIFFPEPGYTAAAIVGRAAVFILEGLLLCLGIARLRRATRRAARNEDWNRRIVDTAYEGIWVLDERGIITYANPRIAEIAGAPLEELVGRRQRGDFFPEDLSIERIRFENRRAGMKEQFDRRLRRSDGCEVVGSDLLQHLLESRKRKSACRALDDDGHHRAQECRMRAAPLRSAASAAFLKMYSRASIKALRKAASWRRTRCCCACSVWGANADLNDVNIASDLYVDTGLRSRLLERLEQEGSFQNVQYELRRRDGETITVQENARVVRDEEGAPPLLRGHSHRYYSRNPAWKRSCARARRLRLWHVWRAGLRTTSAIF